MENFQRKHNNNKKNNRNNHHNKSDEKMIELFSSLTELLSERETETGKEIYISELKEKQFYFEDTNMNSNGIGIQFVSGDHLTLKSDELHHPKLKVCYSRNIF